MFSDKCLVYSLKQNKLPQEIIEIMKIKCLNRYVNKKHLKEICDEYGLCIKLITCRNDSTRNKTIINYVGNLKEHK